MPLTSWGLLVLKPSIGIGADAMAFSFSLGLLRL
jgi:hypothetical protein